MAEAWHHLTGLLLGPADERQPERADPVAGVHAELRQQQRAADDDDLQPCPVESLKKALGTFLPVQKGTQCTVLRVTAAPREVRAGATRRAILLDALQMTGRVQALPGEVASWADRSDLQRIARLCGQVIEVRGCGGGLFRRLYASFLEGEGLTELAQLSTKAADAWTALAQALQQRDLARAEDCARQCVIAEETLWSRAREQCE